MDLRTVMTISTFLLMAAEAELSTINNVTSIPDLTNNTSRGCTCPTAVPATNAASTPTPSTPAPTLGFFTIKWTNPCAGDIQLILYPTAKAPLPVCGNNEKYVRTILGNVCQDKTGCKGTPDWKKRSTTLQTAYYISDSGVVITSCATLLVQCADADADKQGQQLQAYKVVTALLCCVLLVLLLIRFTRPTVKALQKRLSDRRQNRWIGPTQSHSVSYHRGKTAVKNNDGEKRLSYPALERLTVSDSREPSSNRNSGYTF